MVVHGLEQFFHQFGASELFIVVMVGVLLFGAKKLGEWSRKL
jgi:Sec-independent protein translocase protein TatA